MRLLGIDYGTKRIGLALTNEDGTMAFPHATIENTDMAIRDVAELSDREGVGEIVVGLSHNLENDPNRVQSAIEGFVGALSEETGLPVHLEPEWYTTGAALRLQGRTKDTDASAAALILDAYIQKRSNP